MHDHVGDPTESVPSALLTDVEAAARVWRAIERIHQEIFKDLGDVRSAASELHDCIMFAKDGAR